MLAYFCRAYSRALRCSSARRSGVRLARGTYTHSAATTRLDCIQFAEEWFKYFGGIAVYYEFPVLQLYGHVISLAAGIPGVNLVALPEPLGQPLGIRPLDTAAVTHG